MTPKIHVSHAHSSRGHINQGVVLGSAPFQMPRFFATIPYIDWLFLGRWFISHLLLLFGNFSSLHQGHFRPSKSPLLAVHF